MLPVQPIWPLEWTGGVKQPIWPFQWTGAVKQPTWPFEWTGGIKQATGSKEAVAVCVPPCQGLAA